MLLNLAIRDLAIIDAVEVELAAGFTVITGETGAGKSILVDALCIAMGARASATQVRGGAACGEVEALFDISGHPAVRARLEARELTGDDANTLLVRRVIGPRGRAKVVVNGRLATVATLGELVRGLVDISGQHEQQSLLAADGHRDILDAYGGLTDAVRGCREAGVQLRACVGALQRRREGAAEALRRADFVRFCLDEIAAVAPEAGEQEALAQQSQVLAHAERLRQGVAETEALLYGDDGAAFDKLGRAVSELRALARLDPSLGVFCEQLAEARRSVEETARDLQRHGNRIEADPQRLEAVGQRLQQLVQLGRKHGGGTAEVLAQRDALGAELAGLERADAHIAELEAAAAAARAALAARTAALVAARQAAAVRFDRAIAGELRDMDLGGAVFRTCVAEPSPTAADGGAEAADAVEFLWSANRGEAPRPLARIASGGELSRLMLAVKGVLTRCDLVSVYVFDEVDAGLGGRAADSIGRKIQAVARGHQALTITHLAPIAARADRHLRVDKKRRGARTVSQLTEVRGDARVAEIARMIDGAAVGQATLRAARAMLQRSRPRRGRKGPQAPGSSAMASVE